MRFIHLLWLLTLLPLSVTAQSDSTKAISKRQYFTQPILKNPPQIDGFLDEPCWDLVEWSGDFTQNQPDDGGKPTLETAIKILYDEKNLYVAARCFDPAPDSIVSRMSRRDGFEGDWVEINIDSYHDKRTAFSFTSSVSGVKGDEFVSNNGNNWDASWDPIWYLKTQIDSLGWIAELRIPLSQLRFSNEPEQVWGIQFTRRDFRNESRSIWQYIPATSGFWVSGFGELHGIRNIKPLRQIELQPYVVVSAEAFEKEDNNPFATGSDFGANAGLDGKIGITNDLTLDFTINPDFGQVEADPGVLNIDGFRIFFPERRPFFIENRNIFDYQVTRADAGGNFTSDNLFYSRRIGGPPHRYPDHADDEFADVPANTSILGAAKFSGKTSKNLSIGLLQSVTAEEQALIDRFGERRSVVVEPLSSFTVARLQQDFDGGNTLIGGIFTATNRFLEGTDINDLHRSAYTGGLDFTQQWKDQAWQATGRLIFSAVNGSTEAITKTQTNFEHLFQRPDADYLSVDTTATSLLGHGGTFTLARYGGNFKFQTGTTWRSPGLELNDVGFMRNADAINHFAWAGYRINKPFSIFREFRVNYNHWASWDFGGNPRSQSINTNVHGTFTNFWGLGTGVNYEFLDISNRALFGGPALRRIPGMSNWWYGFTDSRKKVMLELNGFWAKGFQNSVNTWELGFWLRVQPTNALNFSIGPNYNAFQREIQYVTDLDVDGQTRYLTGDVLQKTLSLTLRLNYNITPNLTIQYYGQPFISQGLYSDFKFIENPMALQMEDQFSRIPAEQLAFVESDNLYTIDQNQDGNPDLDFYNPDFSYMQFRSNLVARWEYVPGSELFLVWTQNNDNSGIPNDPIVGSLTNNLFNRIPHNIFLIKWTYRWIRT